MRLTMLTIVIKLPKFDCDVLGIDQLSRRFTHAKDATTFSAASHYIRCSSHWPENQANDKYCGQKWKNISTKKRVRKY